MDCPDVFGYYSDILAYVAEHTMKSAGLVCVGVALLLSSCASLGDPFVLAFDVDGEYQSRAVTSAGIDAYRTELVGAGDLDASGKVQHYFEVALRYDPSNTEAARYLALVEDYRAGRFLAAVKNADLLLKKPARSADDEYALLLAVRRASAIYPQDESTIRLLKSTAAIRSSFVADRKEEVKATRAAVPKDAKDAIREKASIDAFRIALRINAVAPADLEGSQLYRELKSEVAAIVARRIDKVDALVKDARFDDARAQLQAIQELDSISGGSFTDTVRDAEYRLYLSWARYHEKRKEWPKADARVKSALAVRRGSEAVALEKRIAASVSAQDRGASFNEGLKNLDAYIAKDDLIHAQRLLSSLASGPIDASKRQALDLRRRKMADSMANLYAIGIKAYRDERFADAASAFESVIAVDASYEDAAAYLDKARAKQKLLDQY